MLYEFQRKLHCLSVSTGRKAVAFASGYKMVPERFKVVQHREGSGETLIVAFKFLKGTYRKDRERFFTSV